MYIPMPDRTSAVYASRYFRSRLVGWILINTRSGKRLTSAQFKFIPNPKDIPVGVLAAENIDVSLVNYFGIEDSWNFILQEMNSYIDLKWDEYGNRITV